MPAWIEYSRATYDAQHDAIGLSASEVVELVSAFRLCGYWRLEIDTGHFYGTKNISRIFGLEHTEGPMNLVAICSLIHPDDMPSILETYERVSTERLAYHNIYRVKTDAENYKFVRTIGKVRPREGTSGEVVGVTYEFFPPTTGVAYFENDELPFR